MTGTAGRIRIGIGIGGWTYEPWRDSFYPDSLAQKDELHHASRRLTSIEVNGTFYRTQSPETFAKWHDETPADFVFALKAPRYATNRRNLAEAAPSIERFLGSGIVALKNKLGPLNRQFPPTKAFDPAEFEAFLKLLPGSHEGRALRHAVEMRHDSFRHPDAVGLLHHYGVSAVIAGDAPYPQIADPTADFIYARIMGATAEEPKGYGQAELDLWAGRSRDWAKGELPADLDYVGRNRPGRARDVFLYVISGYKAHNPAAAIALIDTVG